VDYWNGMANGNFIQVRNGRKEEILIIQFMGKRMDDERVQTRD
jgi:hypothetical protein